MIGQTSPGWQASAYVNGEQKQITSEDYRDRWHILYFYPLDFTFICPTEIVGFQSLMKEFSDESTDIIGVSTDSYFSHAAWLQDRNIFPEAITHPVLADTAHSVSSAFGVLKKDEGVAYRATVIIDDQSIIRSISINDLSAGRNPSETLRTIQALRSGGLCPADWRKGEKFAA